MTTQRKSLANPARPVEGPMTAALVLAVVAGLAWTVGMLYTVLQWQA
ncbi:hypothetical protein ABZ619_37815 [Streptomyces sp. NPDC007851]|nr:hypothetical protein [Streptomyces humi]